ncbi:hypothetical protein FRC02_012349 [Tulasnella sp. 418]|nr:hypothetical protein FRC02_012349 [Tulasnella sp. 418]
MALPPTYTQENDDFPARSVLKLSYSYILENHSVDELRQPAVRSDDHVFHFLLSLELVWPGARWRVVAPDVGTHLKHLSEAYEVFDILCSSYDMFRLWDAFENYWNLEGRNVDPASDVFMFQKMPRWTEMLLVSTMKIREEFYTLYDTLGAAQQQEYAAYAAVVPREDEQL